MKNYINESFKKFMADNNIELEEEFMLFENNTGSDSYFGTYKFSLDKTSVKEEKYELVNISFPEIFYNEDYDNNKIEMEMLSGDYEIRKLAKQKDYVWLVVKKEYTYQENDKKDHKKDKLDDIIVFSNEDAAIAYLKQSFDIDLTENFDKSVHNYLKEKFEDDIRHGILQNKLDIKTENYLHTVLEKAIYKRPVYTK